MVRLPCVFGEFVMSTISAHMGPSPGGIAVWWRNRFCGGRPRTGAHFISRVYEGGKLCRTGCVFSSLSGVGPGFEYAMVGAVVKYGFLESGPKISSK